MSGTSMDGIDVALVRFSNRGQTLPSVLAFETYAFPAELEREIRNLVIPNSGDVERLARLHWALGHAYANAVLQLKAQYHIDFRQVDFVATHGQTIRHFPDAPPLGSLPAAGTLQIGEASVIAQKTGLPTIFDFRSADIAAGGQGAPLVPIFDYYFFRHGTEDRILLNLGGIANFTYLPAGCQAEEVIAFDCGPGNMLLDALAQRFFSRKYDPQGAFAGTGNVHEGLLQKLLQHPFLQRPYPKSAGREAFGEPFIRQLIEQARAYALRKEDILATATFFTARAIADAIAHLQRKQPRFVMYVSGGGRRNKTLMRHLGQLLKPNEVRDFDRTGISGDAKEAVCFAFLGYRFLLGQPSGLPQVTGAEKPARLGKVCLPP